MFQLVFPAGNPKGKQMFVETSMRGVIRHACAAYGKSHEGNPLTVWLPEGRDTEILVLASIHGDESETTVVLSDALRAIRADGLKNAAILCANPDGIVRGTRGNAKGVDLNRNFPTDNWRPDPVYYKSRENEPQGIALSPGTHRASEPETQALLLLLEELKPRAVVTLHAALACIDDADGSLLGRRLAEKTGLPLQADVGYATPGSFGSWALEQNLNLVTYEFEAASPYELKERHTSVFIELLTGKINIE